MMDQFRFDDAEKGFGHGIIPAVTFTAHALDEYHASLHLSKLITSTLDAAIRVNQHPGTRTTIANTAGKGCYKHFSAQRTAQRPADHHTGEQIDKDRQVKPALCCGALYVISEHPHTLSGPWGLKSRFKRLSATG